MCTHDQTAPRGRPAGPPAPARPGAPAVRDVLVVAAGGALGTTLRLGVARVLPDAGPLPVAVVVTNLTGAFALGWLLAVLAGRAGTPRARAARLGLGTGVLGGYTTYSAFAVGTDGLLTGTAPLAGLALSVATVVAGVLAARTGATLARSDRGGRP